ncbi:Sugar kinase of the NBD/HSP70 family, may contain an N-terminal HTH domain [Paenibacillus sp. UNC496MF]|uniref:ROK family transcriptional regulator n=1 Tax=Paenibacillus sp. UNC496MF TaxID=1502753 RepID=UPI0008E3581F|nr:ROK family transcriptional regulator [Paenibacillus sp. UNC496MF]SFJ48333.1 Sugar kinase of the NBD/HSP70 family, may contain an N-terminal HTH domain [Paenibacillus sp. UNC496MF]
MKQTGDLALVKKMNTAIVLDAVLRYAPLSRAQISERTGLNKATVSSLVQDLIEHHLVIDIGPGESSGGRKPNLLQFRARTGFAIGIDLGVNYIRGILTDLEGVVLAERRLTLTAHDAAYVLPRLLDCIASLQAEIPPCPYGTVGVGIGVPGLVNEEGAILYAPNLDWTDVPLRAIVEERFGVPVTIDNEANAGAQGEQRYGAGRGVANQIYVSAGIGIGTGMILNKELYKGAGGFSGELGHLSIQADGKPCRCGNRGCWELYASENALLEQAAALGYRDLDGLLEAAGRGEAEVLRLFERIGEALGVGIANIVNVFNPDVVIVGNELRRAEAWLGEAMQRTVAERALAHHRRRLRVLFAEQGEKSAVRGAAYYAISAFLSKMKGSGV